MSYAARNDGTGWRAVAGPNDCSPNETWKADNPQLVAPTFKSSITPRQIRQVLTASGIRAQVEAAVADGDQDLKDWWEFSSSFERYHPVLVEMATDLGLTDDQIDNLFDQAALL